MPPTPTWLRVDTSNITSHLISLNHSRGIFFVDIHIWKVGSYPPHPSIFFIIQRFLFSDQTLTAKRLSVFQSPPILSSEISHETKATPKAQTPPPPPVMLTSGQLCTIFRLHPPHPPRDSWLTGKKDNMRFAHNLSPDLMDDLSAFSALQVRRAKTPRLCWNDGQVSDLKVHLWCGFWETTVKFLPQLVKVPVKPCFSRCSLTREQYDLEIFGMPGLNFGCS